MGIPQAAARPPRRRSDAGQVRLQQRDLDGLLLVAEQYAAPYDLLADALAVTPARVRAATARWRAAGPAGTAMRARINERFTQLHAERTTAETKLAALASEQ